MKLWLTSILKNQWQWRLRQYYHPLMILYLQVFLEYSDISGCANARNALNGRKFGGNVVSAVYYPEDKYYIKDYGA